MKIMIVEDDRSIRIALRLLLQYELPHVQIQEFMEEESALAGMETFEPDAVIFDLKHPGVRGFKFIRTLNERWNGNYPVLALSAMGSFYKERALEAGARCVLSKPFQNNELVDHLRTLFRERKLEQEVRMGIN